MSGIRVTYSGLIAFVASIVTVLTGFLFTIIITRQLSQDEFGTWSLIGGLVSYVYIFRPLIGYWCTREIARGIESGKTAFSSTGILAALAVFVYLLIAYFFGKNIEVDQTLLIFAAILIPVEYFNQILKRINQGYRPHMEEYGLLTFEIIKIPIALGLVYFLELGLMGIIITVFFANLASIFLLLITTRQKLVGSFKKEYLKKWVKLFWIPTYPNISQIINVSDVAVVTLITGSVGGLAYWAAARAIAHTVNHSSKIGKAIYPKLLGGAKKEFFQENLVLMFYFALPLSAMSIIFARPGLFALNPLYEVAIFVVIFLVPSIFLRTLSELFKQALSGIENIDTKENAKFMDYLKSKLFYLPTLKIIQRASYLGVLIVVLLLMAPIVESDIQLIVYWAIIALATQIPYTLYLYVLLRREFKPQIESKIIFKYLLTSILVFGSVYYLMEQYLQYYESIFEFLPGLLPYLVLGIGSYLGITYLIDKRTRILFNKVLKEFQIK